MPVTFDLADEEASSPDDFTPAARTSFEPASAPSYAGVDYALAQRKPKRLPKFDTPDFDPRRAAEEYLAPDASGEHAKAQFYAERGFDPVVDAVGRVVPRGTKFGPDGRADLEHLGELDAGVNDTPTVRAQMRLQQLQARNDAIASREQKRQDAINERLRQQTADAPRVMAERAHAEAGHANAEEAKHRIALARFDKSPDGKELKSLVADNPDDASYLNQTAPGGGAAFGDTSEPRTPVEVPIEVQDRMARVDALRQTRDRLAKAHQEAAGKATAAQMRAQALADERDGITRQPDAAPPDLEASTRPDVHLAEIPETDADGRQTVDSLVRMKNKAAELKATLDDAGGNLAAPVRARLKAQISALNSASEQGVNDQTDEGRKAVSDATRASSMFDVASGAVKSLADSAAQGGSAVLKGAQLVSDALAAPARDEFGVRDPQAAAENTRRATLTPSQKLDETLSGPAYQLGSLISDSASEFYAKSKHEDAGTISKGINAAAEAAGGFAPLLASGPLAPVTMGLQTAGNDVENIYRKMVARGTTPDGAADFAVKRALASGAVQAAIFEFLPKPLAGAVNKGIADRIAKGALTKFLTNRLAQGAEGAVLGAGSKLASNATTGEPLTDGVTESAAGLALAQGVMPRGALPAKTEGDVPPAPETPPETPNEPTAPVEPAPPTVPLAPMPPAIDKPARITEMLAQGHTPAEVAAEVGVPLSDVHAVRESSGIPSADDPAALEAWKLANEDSASRNEPNAVRVEENDQGAGRPADSAQPKENASDVATAPVAEEVAQNGEVAPTQLQSPPEAVESDVTPTEVPTAEAAAAPVEPVAIGDRGTPEEQATKPAEPAAEVPAPVETPPAPPVAESATTPETPAPDEGVGIKNASVDKMLEDLKQAPEAPREGTPNKEMHAGAIARVQADPEAGAKLVQELHETKRQATGEESVLVTHELRRTHDRVKAAQEDLIRATESGDEDGVKRATIERDVAQEQFNKAKDVSYATGTQWSDTGRARQILLKQDFSIANLTRNQQIANRGEPVTKEQHAEIQKISDGYEKRLKDLNEAVTASEKARAEESQKRAEAEANVALLKMANEGQRARPPTAKARPVLDSLISRGNEAQKRILANMRSGKTRASLVLGFEDAKDYAQVVAGYIARGVKNAADLSTRLIKDFGEGIRPHIPQLLKLGTDEHARQMKALTETGRDTVTERNATVANMKARLASGEKLSDLGVPVKEIIDQHLADGVKFRGDAMHEAVTRTLQEVDPSITRSQALDAIVNAELTGRAMKALDSKINQINAELRTETVFGAGKPRPIHATELTTKKAELAALKEQRDYMREGIQPRDFAAEKSQRDLVRLRKTTEALKAKLAAGDFTKPERAKPIPQLDPKVEEVRGELERYQQEYHRKQEELEKASRPTWQRGADFFTNLRRFGLISGIKTMGKLGVAGQARIGMTAADTAAGSLINKIPGVRDIAAGAPREGNMTGRTVENLTKGYVEGWRYVLAQAGKVLKTGKTDAEVNAGAQVYEPSFLNYLANTHALLKLPAFAQEYKISLRERTAYELKKGTDMTNPVNQIRVNNEAVADGIRAKFGQDNVLTDGFNGLVRMLEKNKSHPDAGQAISLVLRFMFPIRHIPSNFLAESATYSNLGLGLPRATYKAFNAIRGGVDKLTPEQKDSIIRHFKKGSLGAGLMLLGYYNRANVGGFYQPGEKDKKTPQFGGIRIGDTDIPRWLVHLPIFAPLHIGATIGHVMDKINKKTKQPGTVADGVSAASVGLLDESPFIGGAKNALEAMDTDSRGTYARGEMAKGALLPKAISDIAEMTDTDAKGDTIKRKMDTVGAHIQAGIPMLREKLPRAPIKK